MRQNSKCCFIKGRRWILKAVSRPDVETVVFPAAPPLAPPKAEVMANSRALEL